jgi:hypothetical protein
MRIPEAQRSNDLLTGSRVLAVVAMSIALTFLVFSGSALASSPTEVQTEPAEAIPGGAKLKGQLNPSGLPTTYYFIYARDTCDEGCTPSKTATSGPLTGDTEQEVPAVDVTGLSGSGGSERYWDILVATNADGTVYGGLVNFTPGAPLPSIEGESVSHVTSTDATLEAQIDVESLRHGADYQFQIVENTSEYASELICPSTRPQGHEICVGPQSPGAAPIGFAPSGEEGPGPLKSSPVSLDLGGAGITLKPGTTYHYRVLAARSVQTEDTIQWEGPTVYGADRTFTTPSAGTAPVIDSVSISHLTPTDATLEAQIDTEGSSTSYEFQMWSSPCSKKGDGCELLIDVPLPTGLLLGSFVPQSVSLDLNSVGVTLGGGEYGFSVLATNKAGSTNAGGGVFEAPPPTVVQPLSTIPPLYGAGPPAGSSANSGDQPAGSGSSSSSSTPGVQPPGGLGKTTKLEPFENAQKLSKALKLCTKKPKSQRSSCKRQAEKKYSAPSKHRR